MALDRNALRIVCGCAQDAVAVGAHGHYGGAARAVVGADDEGTAQQPFALERNAGARQRVVFGRRAIAQDLEYRRKRSIEPGRVQGIQGGAVTVRAAYLKATGAEVPSSIEVTPTLILADALREAKVTTIADLAAVFPGLTTDDLVPVS